MSPSAVQQMVDFLRKEIPGLQAVYLYGSGARNELRADSDLDLAVVAASPLSWHQRWTCAVTLSGLLERDIDLVDMQIVGLPLIAQILESGRPLFVADEPWLARFENLLMSRWCAFNEERRALMADILARGSVYGR